MLVNNAKFYVHLCESSIFVSYHLKKECFVIFRIGYLFFRLPEPPVEDFLGVAAPVVVIDSACFIVVRIQTYWTVDIFQLHSFTLWEPHPFQICWFSFLLLEQLRSILSPQTTNFKLVDVHWLLLHYILWIAYIRCKFCHLYSIWNHKHPKI